MKVMAPKALWPSALIRTAVVALVAVLVASLSSCSKSDPGFEYMRVSVDGQQTLAISKKGVAVRGVVVFFHGLDGDEFTLTSEDAHRAVTEKLVNAGFALTASAAGGNAFGNPGSQENYRQLIQMALAHYGVENVFFLADSMGAIAAMNIYASIDSARIRGLAAFNPLVNLAEEAPKYSQFSAEGYPDSDTFNLSDPMQFPATAFDAKKLRFYVSPSDSVVSADSNALAFQKRFGEGADLTTVECAGQHGDPSCFQGDDVLKWFTSLETRTGG
jgi:pimeloyl-ACP methyl ester carboxylesterase